MIKRTGLILLVLLSLPVGFIAFEKFQFRRPGIASGCPDWVLSQVQTSIEIVHPEKLVVEPWQGRHNVYATFKIPAGYQPSPFFVVTLEGSNPYCGNIISRPTTSHSNDSSRDRQVIGLFRTRTTLWIATKGQLGQLERSSNWKLVILKQS